MNPLKITIKTLAFMFLCLFWGQSQAVASEGCFYKHVADAIVINKERKTKYKNEFESGVLRRASKNISSRLIILEYMLVPIAKALDWAAEPYQNLGSDFMCNEFVEMSEVGQYRGKVEGGDLENPLNENYVLNSNSFERKILSLIIKSKYDELFVKSDEYIQWMFQEIPNHYCMYRHFVESIRRIAQLAPQHIEFSRKNNLKSPKKLIRRLLLVHFLGFSYAKTIDKMAIPLQNKGVPILCNDVPHIPVL